MCSLLCVCCALWAWATNQGVYWSSLHYIKADLTRWEWGWCWVCSVQSTTTAMHCLCMCRPRDSQRQILKSRRVCPLRKLNFAIIVHFKTLNSMPQAPQTSVYIQTMFVNDRKKINMPILNSNGGHLLMLCRHLVRSSPSATALPALPSVSSQQTGNPSSEGNQSSLHMAKDNG